MKSIIKSTRSNIGSIFCDSDGRLKLIINTTRRDRSELKTIFFVLEEYFKDLGYSVQRVKNTCDNDSGIKNKEYHRRHTEADAKNRRAFNKEYPSIYRTGGNKDEWRKGN